MRRSPVKRFHPPGTAPGTLAFPEAETAPPTRISLLTFGEERLGERRVAALAEVPFSTPGGRKSWLRIVGHSAATLGGMTDRFGIHPLVVEDIINLGQRPKVEEFDGYCFVIVDVLRTGPDRAIEEEQISLLIFEDLLITVQERQSDLFKRVEDRLQVGQLSMPELNWRWGYAAVSAVTVAIAMGMLWMFRRRRWL